MSVIDSDAEDYQLVDPSMEMEEDLFASDAESEDGRRNGAGADDNDADGHEKDKQEEEEEAKKEEQKRKIKAKKDGPSRRVLLSEDMITGKTGLVKLQELFKDFKLQGRGHELKDINAILFKLERWIHILHPKYQFNQTLERIEFLGSKKRSIKTYLKKLRLGMITNNEDDILGEDMPRFDPSDHEMNADEDYRNPIEIPSNVEGDFPSGTFDDDPFGNDSDEEDMLAALDRLENTATGTGSAVSEAASNQDQGAMNAESDSDDEVLLSQIKKRSQQQPTTSTNADGMSSDNDDVSGVSQTKKKRMKSAIIESDSDSDMENLFLKKKAAEPIQGDIELGGGNVASSSKTLVVGGQKSHSDHEASSEVASDNAVSPSAAAGNQRKRIKLGCNVLDSDSDEDNGPVRATKKIDSKTIGSDSDEDRVSAQHDHHSTTDRAMGSDSDSEVLTDKMKDATTRFICSDSDD